jgi:hypothetical protein
LSKTSENTFRISYSRQKKFGKHVPNFKIKGKKGNPGGKKSRGKRKFHFTRGEFDIVAMP